MNPKNCKRTLPVTLFCPSNLLALISNLLLIFILSTSGRQFVCFRLSQMTYKYSNEMKGKIKNISLNYVSFFTIISFKFNALRPICSRSIMPSRKCNYASSSIAVFPLHPYKIIFPRKIFSRENK